MNNTKKNTIVSYDGITKVLLDMLSDGTIVQFINYTFAKNYDSDASVTRMATETTDHELKQKRCDYLIRINDELFLIEIQSKDDHDMAMRVFEYSIRGAKLHSKSIDDDGVVELTVPDPVVFYLRKGSDPHDQLVVRLRNQSGESFEVKAEAIYLNDYSFSDMIDKYMFPMMPFYSMRYEQILLREHTEEDEENILADLMECIKMLKEAYRNGIINAEIYQYIREWLVAVFRVIVNRALENHTYVNEQEADRVMQMILDEPIEGFDIFKALSDSKTEGREEGEIKGKIEGVDNLVSQFNFSLQDALKAMNLSESEYNELKK